MFAKKERRKKKKQEGLTNKKHVLLHLKFRHEQTQIWEESEGFGESSQISLKELRRLALRPYLKTQPEIISSVDVSSVVGSI